MRARPRLNKTDWILAAFRALTRGGPQAIKAELIARDLSVSKGSFYWHFKDVADLRAAMIRHWRQQATDAVIAALDDGGASPQSRLRGLIEITSSDRYDTYGGPLVEAAIRDWARCEGAVMDAVHEVDRRRLAYVEGLFGECGFGGDAARANARTLYGALIGLDLLSYLDGADVGADMRLLLERMLGGTPVG